MSDRSPRGDNDDGTPAAPRDHVDDVLERLRAHQARSGRHEVRQELGRGGMGLVLEVHDRDLLRPLAMKRLRAERRDEEDPERRRHFIARFLQEAQITGQLGHPGIPPVHELALDSDGEPFFTMPLIRGKTLEVVLDDAHATRNGWNIPRALAVVLKVCEAMSFAHAKRIVHRDLKPANVMIGRFGEVYVMDWGLARVIGSDRPDVVRWSSHGQLSSVDTDRKKTAALEDAPLETLDGDVLGTPFFMPPEQASGDLARVGARSDIYAVGAMLYLLLTGRPPYAPSSGGIAPRIVLGLVMHGPPTKILEIAPGTDPDLVAICEKAMAREIDHRYDTMEALAADIEAWLGRRPIQASAPSVRHALRLFAERHRAAVSTAAAATLAFVAAGSAFVWRLTEERDAKEKARIDAQRRGDLMATSALLSLEKQLWPAEPARVPAMESWLDQIADLESRLDEYRQDLSSRAATPEVRDELLGLVSGSERVLSVRQDVLVRLQVARSLRVISIDDARADWERAMAEIAQLPAYGGLRIEPQLGLVPLERDASSGLWEFWLVPSGARPSTTSNAEGEGITLVLVPAGILLHGAVVETEGDRRRWQFDEQIIPETIKAHFVAKHEVTQAQWNRVIGNKPSRWQPGVTAGVMECPACPVESVSWLDSAEFARRLGVRLPTEFEWEYDARGASPHADLVYGESVAAIEGHENVRDASAGSIDGAPAVDWNDGFPQVAPVGSFAPNRFGLHDVLGNVSEWCADRFTPVPVSELRAGDPAITIRVFRGGSWYGSVLTRAGCVWFRQWDKAEGLNHARGFRVVRSLSESL